MCCKGGRWLARSHAHGREKSEKVLILSEAQGILRPVQEHKLTHTLAGFVASDAHVRWNTEPCSHTARSIDGCVFVVSGWE